MREKMREICSLIPRYQKILLLICLITELFRQLIMYFADDEVIFLQLPELRIDTATLTQLDVTSAGLGPAELTASLDLTVLAINPNVLHSFDIYSIEALLIYKMLDETMYVDGRRRLLLAAKPVIASSFLPTRRNTTLSFKLKTSDGTVVDQYRVAEPISEAKVRGGSVFLEIKMLVWWDYRRRRSILPGRGGGSLSLGYKVFCSQLEFAFDNKVTQTWILTVDSSRECEHEQDSIIY